MNKNGNILLALSGESSTPTAISSLLLELDIQLPPDRTSLVVDHFNYDTISASEKHDVLLLPQPSSVRTDLRQFFGGNRIIAFPRAVAQELGNLSPLLTPILQADTTAYSYNPKEEVDTVEDPFATGSQIALVSAMQARNSARFTVLGSVEALENVWFDASVQGVQGSKSKTANREFARQLTEWTFKETGVLKVGRVEHHLSAIEQDKSGNNSVSELGSLNPKIYRVKNDVVRFVNTFTELLRSYMLNYLKRLLSLSSLNTRTHIGHRQLFLLPMLCSLNFQCCRHFTVSRFYRFNLLRTVPSIVLHSLYQINMGFLLSRSITNGLS